MIVKEIFTVVRDTEDNEIVIAYGTDGIEMIDVKWTNGHSEIKLKI